MRAHYVAAWIVLAWVAAPTAGVSGADDQSAADQSSQTIAHQAAASDRNEREPIRFQRIMVPADRPEDWPREKGVHYLPMSADEFERRATQLGSRTSQIAGHSQLIRAEYSARLEGDGFVDGDANWEFAHIGEPEVLVLGQCQLPLGDFRWTSSTKSSAPSELRAIVGNDELGRLAAFVDRAGEMRGRWSLAGVRGPDGALTFAQQLPGCAVNVLKLTLPAGSELAVDRGELIATVGEADGKRTWVVQLGGYHEVNLRVSPQIEAASSRSAVREAHQFTISERGLELSSEFQIAMDGPAPQRIGLSVESPLKLMSVRWNGANLDIEDAEGAEAADNQNSSAVTINLPAQLQGGGVLEARAIAPWQLGTRSRLPLVHVWGARWEQGRARLLVPHHLELRQLLLRDCRQTAADVATDADSDAAEIQFFNDHPAIDVAIARLKEQVYVAQGTSVLLRANEGVAHCTAALSCKEGERFVLEAEVNPQWIIDRVESVPDGLVADWSQKYGQGRPSKLTVRLSEPISPEQEVEFLISARRLRPPKDDKLSCDDLAMLRFLDTVSVRRIVDVQTTEANQLQIQGADELNRLDPAELSDEDAGLLLEAPGGLSFVADDGARELSVSLAAKAADFDADIHGEFVAADDSFSESYRFTITPHGRDVGHFSVRFSQPRPEAIDWSIDGEPGSALSARRISTAELAANGLAGGEVWEVSLPLARQTPFVVIANRTTAIHDSMPMALASVIDAETQHGTVQIHSIARNLPEITSRRPAIPVEAPASDQLPTALAAFQYTPEEDALLSAEPPLVLTLHPDAPKPAWIWEAELASRYMRYGSEQVLTCRVENAGRQRIQFQAPPGAQWRGAWIDDQPLTSPPENERWRINLPAGKRLCTVVVRWTDATAIGGLAARQRATWPECDVPILNRAWAVELPPNVSLADADISGMQAVIVPWTKRLFGPLGGSNSILQSDAANSSIGNGRLPPNPISAAGESVPGWSCYRFDGIGSAASSIWIAEEQRVSAWAWTFFLLAAVTGWLIGRRSAAVEVAILGIATSLALVVPAHWVPLTAGIWLGLASGRLVLQATRWLPERSGPPKTSNESLSASISLKTATASVCLGLLTAAHGLLRADEAAHERAKPASYGVLVPVDSQGRAVGDLVYLPERFYSLLEKSTSNATASVPTYLITGARYRAGGTAAAAGNWQADLEIESLSERVTAKLPLGLSGAALIPDGVQLDGSPAPIRIDDTERFVCLDLEHAGSHRVAITFRPIRARDRYDFEVPIVSSAQVGLSGWADPTTRVASALGARQPSGDPTAGVSLGPANRIMLQHAIASAPAAVDSPKFDVAALYWLRIRQGSVGLEARFHVNVQSGRLDRLRLEIDPRWKSLAAPAGGVQPHIDPNDPRTVEFDLSHAISGQGTIDARFALDGATGIGCWRVPEVEVQGAAKSRQSWAATIDPALVYEQRLGPGETKIPAANFAARWPSGEAHPQAAWESASGGTETAIFTRTQDPKLTARYSMALVAADKDVSIRLGIDVISSEPMFQCRVAVPGQMEVDSVSLREQEGQHSCRWSLCNNILTVFLPSPTTGDHQLLLVGRMPVLDDGILTIPQLHVDQSAGAGFVALVYRRPEALLEISNLAGLTNPSQSDVSTIVANARREVGLGAASAREGRLAAVLVDPREVRPAILHIQRNEPQLSLAQVTRLDHNAESWTATSDVDLAIEKGTLDSIRFDLPANWLGPFEVSPAMPHSVEEVPGEYRRQLVLRPQEPLAGNVELRISGPLTIFPGQRPAAPDLRLANAARRTLSFYLLPRRSETEQLAWDRRRLAPTLALPPSLAARVPKLENYQLYRLSGERGSATLRSVEHPSQSPVVRLADAIVSWANDDHASGTVAFDLEPASETACELQMPPDCHIVAARLDSAPAQLTPLAASRWNVWLGDNKLPRRLEVVFEGRLASRSGGTRQIVMPAIISRPVEQTLWTVIGPKHAGSAMLQEGVSVSSAAQDRLRLESLSALGTSAASLLANEPADEIANWCLPWIQRIAACRERLLATTGARADSPKQPELDIGAVDQEFAKIQRRLAIEDLAAGVLADGASTTGRLALMAPRGSVAFAVQRGRGPSLSAEYPSESGTSTVARPTVALVLALAAVLLVWFDRGPRFSRLD